MPAKPPIPAAATESTFLAWVRQRQALQLQESSHLHVVPGDDLAVFEWPGGLVLLGVDPVLDGVHIELAQHGPSATGRKAMNRNLSDVAAMAGHPVAATLSLVVPRSMSMADVQEIYIGAEAAGAAAGCPIVGGDFASWDGRLVATVGILGRTDRPLLRGAARPGQTLFVTGPLGGSILGRHLSFEPRLAMGQRIARDFSASAMIDISDGLSRDLPRLLGESAGAVIDAAAVPIHTDARTLAARTGREPLWHALHDGEDYELLFAADAAELPDCTAIGRVVAETGVRLRDGNHTESLPQEGWEHRLE